MGRRIDSPTKIIITMFIFNKKKVSSTRKSFFNKKKFLQQEARFFLCQMGNWGLMLLVSVCFSPHKKIVFLEFILTKHLFRFLKVQQLGSGIEFSFTY